MRAKQAALQGAELGRIRNAMRVAGRHIDIDSRPDEDRNLLPLIATFRVESSHKKADKELIEQYRFTVHIFLNARKRIDANNDKREQREILRTLGDKALDEHADWILLYRLYRQCPI